MVSDPLVPDSGPPGAGLFPQAIGSQDHRAASWNPKAQKAEAEGNHVTPINKPLGCLTGAYHLSSHLSLSGEPARLINQGLRIRG